MGGTLSDIPWALSLSLAKLQKKPRAAAITKSPCPFSLLLLFLYTILRREKYIRGLGSRVASRTYRDYRHQTERMSLRNPLISVDSGVPTHWIAIKAIEKRLVQILFVYSLCSAPYSLKWSRFLIPFLLELDMRYRKKWNREER